VDADGDSRRLTEPESRGEDAMRVEAIYVSPVKSLALNRIERAEVGARGIAGDRRFFLADERGRLASQREFPALVQVHARFAIEPEHLRLQFPDGSVVEGAPDSGEPLTTLFFGKREVEGFAVGGDWSRALSEFAGAPLRLVRAKTSAFDGFPLSICSAGSVEMLRWQAGVEAIDERRFRPNLFVSGPGAHGEDEWLGHDVRIGGALVHVHMLDARCEITTHDPDTGAHDMNTLKMIAAYRTDQPNEVNFGVYAAVVEPGTIAVGDAIAVEP
jgi:uncharacterized protein YcbX